jgi:hypothetical protein
MVKIDTYIITKHIIQRVTKSLQTLDVFKFICSAAAVEFSITAIRADRLVSLPVTLHFVAAEQPARVWGR